MDGIGAKNMTREDSDLWLRTRGEGYKTTFDPSMIVYHRVPQGRFSLRFCVRRAFSDGFAAYYRENGERLWFSKLKFILSEPFRIIQRKARRCEGSRVHDAFWIVRECGFVYAHISRYLK